MKSYAVELPRSVHDQLMRACTDRGMVMSRLVRAWVILAADRARRGEPLPAGRQRGPARTPGSHVQTRWRQESAELEPCRKLIDAAGSSLRAVVEQATVEWVKSPPQRDVPRRARTAMAEIAAAPDAEAPRALVGVRGAG